jgi:CDP-6-deoxy-D-xylo-4-hexulose-3-dehydrase
MNYKWPLMMNNIEKTDLEEVILHLNMPDPKLTHGPMVEKFENEWNKWLNSKFSIMVNSGASANDISMLILKEKYGQCEIIVPPLTWVSDIASIIHAGHTPIFVDISLKNLALDSALLEKAITKKTKAIFLTHVLGLNGISEELLNLARHHEIDLIEDVCESHGATYNGNKVGTFGLMSNFSFYYAHHMTTIEGGMISTNSEEIYQYARMMRSHGLVRESNSNEIRDTYANKYPDLNPKFIFAYAAHNMRPTEINGILGSSQLRRLDSNIRARTRNFLDYVEHIDSEKFYSGFETNGSSSYAIPIIMKNGNLKLRDRIELELDKNGIEFRRGLSGGGNQLRQPYLKKIINKVSLENFPVIEHIHSFSWYVGNYPSIKEGRIFELCELLNKI